MLIPNKPHTRVQHANTKSYHIIPQVNHFCCYNLRRFVSSQPTQIIKVKIGKAIFLLFVFSASLACAPCVWSKVPLAFSKFFYILFFSVVRNKNLNMLVSVTFVNLVSQWFFLDEISFFVDNFDFWMHSLIDMLLDFSVFTLSGLIRVLMHV